jgi:DNA-directed RNA polymerase subunit beta'
VVYTEDCGTINGIIISDLKEGEKIVEPLSERILGRGILDDFIVNGEVIVRSGTVLSENEAELIGDSGVENIRIRSILACEAKRGVCAKCYGWDLSSKN